MAKSGFWLRGAKGKLAGSTIYTSAGETVMREIKGSIKNPKTKAQMIQRVISKTTMAQYAALKAIANHSFEGKSAGKWCMARFATLNNKRFRQMAKDAQDAGQGIDSVYNFIPCGQVKFVPAACVLSEGTLPQIYTVFNTDTPAISVDGNTYGDVIGALGLQRGDQLTFVTVDKNATGDYALHVARVILDPRNEDGTPAPLTTAFVENDAIVKPSFRNEGEFTSIEAGSGELLFKLSDDSVAAAGVIASRQVDNDWLRSTCVLTMLDETLENDKLSLEEAVALSLVKTPIYTNSERYLNNAGVGGPQAEDTPSSFLLSINGGQFVDTAVGERVIMVGGSINGLIIKNYTPQSTISWNCGADNGNFILEEGNYAAASLNIDMGDETPVIIKDGSNTIATIVDDNWA